MIPDAHRTVASESKLRVSHALSPYPKGEPRPHTAGCIGIVIMLKVGA
jgi:hypothetical protein